MHKGSCLCGAITFCVPSKLASAEACHCTKCRKWSGHIGVTVEVPHAELTIHEQENIRWYYSSDKARRGFCGTCGTPLFFDPLNKAKHDWIAITMGTFDIPTNTQLSHHIYVAEKVIIIKSPMAYRRTNFNLH